jgi:hypothetical protein
MPTLTIIDDDGRLCDVELSDADYAALMAIAKNKGLDLDGVIDLALETLFDREWPPGVPRPSKQS